PAGTASASGDAVASSAPGINCPRKSSNPILRGGGLLIGSGSTTCKFAGGAPAAMSALTLNVALYQANFPADGTGWTLVDHQFLPDVGVDAILQTAAKFCPPAPKLRYFVI